MKITKQSFRTVLTMVFMFFASGGVMGDDRKNDKVLDVKDKSVKRLESNRTFGGYTKTSVFYAFPKQGAILRVVIDNQKKSFPATATLYTFDGSVTEKGLKKWLNNQTSDALYADAPRQKTKKSLGDGVCKIKKSEHIKDVQGRTGKFAQYKVEFELIKMGAIEGFKIKSLKDTATVFLKMKK